MVINTNIAAETSATMLENSSAKLATSLERLSSGSRIVTAADDPAGLAVSMQFTAQSGEITAAEGNVTNATSYTQTQDGYLQQISNALNRMSELAVSAQDATISNSDRSMYNGEFQQLGSYIANVAGKDFNGVSLFDSTAKTVTIDNNASTWTMGTVDMTTAAYTNAENAAVSSMASASAALGDVNTAISQLATDRATVGANESRLNYTSSQLATEKTNVDAANSAISDVDVAQESTNYARMNILVQSGTAMLAQANVLPQSVLKLIGV
ncbi:MAG: flagellin [Verrucomicrobiota bacterium]|jgi:flagellin